MPGKRRFARVARDRAEYARVIWLDARRDRVISDAEQVLFDAALNDWLAATIATDTADVLKSAMGRATDPEYLKTLFDGYQAAADEMPDSRDAA